MLKQAKEIFTYQPKTVDYKPITYTEEEVRRLCNITWLKQPNTINMLEEFDTWFNNNKKK